MDVSLEDIDQWHKRRGFFFGCGYHYVIKRDGTIQHSKRVNAGVHYQGAHVHGWNDVSIGICLVGGVSRKDRKKEGGWTDAKPENNFTPAQMSGLRELLFILRQSFPKALVIGHRDVPNDFKKDCPCFDVREWLGEEYPIT
jgi:N-acetylmuramoyl-L-alanine amidase